MRNDCYGNFYCISNYCKYQLLVLERIYCVNQISWQSMPSPEFKLYWSKFRTRVNVFLLCWMYPVVLLKKSISVMLQLGLATLVSTSKWIYNCGVGFVVNVICNRSPLYLLVSLVQLRWSVVFRVSFLVLFSYADLIFIISTFSHYHLKSMYLVQLLWSKNASLNVQFTTSCDVKCFRN